MAKNNKKNAKSAAVAVEAVAQTPTALMVGAVAPQTSVHVPLNTADIVNAAAFQWSELLNTHVAAKRGQIAELHEQIEALTKRRDDKLQAAAYDLLLAEANKWPIMAVEIPGLKLEFPTAESFASRTCSLFNTPWKEAACIAVTLTGTQKKGDGSCHVSVTLTLPVSPTMAGRVMSAAHDETTELEELRAELTKRNAEHSTLLQEANDLPRFKQKFSANLTMGALQNSGDNGIAYNELITRLVHQSGEQLTKKLLTAKPGK